MAREYNAARLRSQREVIRDALLSAADCDAWLTLSELRALTRFGEASISAQMRNLKKRGYEVLKRRMKGDCGQAFGLRGNCVWEYRISVDKTNRRLSDVVAQSGQSPEIQNGKRNSL